MNTLFDTKFKPSQKLKRYIGRCAYKKTCGLIKTMNESPYGKADYNDQQCPKCKRWGMSWRQVEGKVSDHKCDARCTSAKGHNCECSCGGANHGANYL